MPQEWIHFICVSQSLPDRSWQDALYPPTPNKYSLMTAIYICPGDGDNVPACLMSLAACHPIHKCKQQVGLGSNQKSVRATTRGKSCQPPTLFPNCDCPLATDVPPSPLQQTSRLFNMLGRFTGISEAGKSPKQDIAQPEDANLLSFILTTFYWGAGIKGIFVSGYHVWFLNVSNMGKVSNNKFSSSHRNLKSHFL